MKKSAHWFEKLTILMFCLVIIGVLHFLTFTLINKEFLEEKRDIERILFDLYIASKSNEQRISTILKDNGVEGIAIYDKSGKMYYHYGITPVYDDLPINQNNFVAGTSNLVIKKNVLEYVGYPQQRGAASQERQGFDLAQFMRELVTQRNQTPIEGRILPLQTVYLRKADSSFVHRVIALRVIQVLSTVIIAMLGMVLWHYEKRNEMLLEKVNKRESKATMSEAARTLAHEIKNPLSTIKIQLAILKKMSPENASDYDLIENEVERLLTLADRTTNFLSNPLGTPKRIKLIPFIAEFCTRFEYPLLIANEPGTDDIAVNFDEIRLRSIIENLIKNAVEASEERIKNEHLDYKEPIRIEVAEKGKAGVRILVQDRGVGLPKGIKADELFNAFYTTKIKGSGIGLSICSQFVEVQGGTINIYDREGGGSVADVVLKRA